MFYAKQSAERASRHRRPRCYATLVVHLGSHAEQMAVEKVVFFYRFLFIIFLCPAIHCCHNSMITTDKIYLKINRYIGSGSWESMLVILVWVLSHLVRCPALQRRTLGLWPPWSTQPWTCLRGNKTTRERTHCAVDTIFIEDATIKMNTTSIHCLGKQKSKQ